MEQLLFGDHTTGGTEFPPRRFVCLDGGLGSLLKQNNVTMDDTLWSGGCLISDPSSVFRAHSEFLYAGADIISTASYQLSFEGLLSSQYGLSGADARGVFNLSTEIAKSAISAFGKATSHAETFRPIVAASLGCYGAHLADGSEYIGRYGKSVAQLYQWHYERFSVIKDTSPDLIAFETVPCVDEVKAIVHLLSHAGDDDDDDDAYACPSWISLSCSSPDHLNSGEPIEDALRCMAEADLGPQKLGVGVNCTDPRHVNSIIHTMRDVMGRSRVLVAYPNLGETWVEVSTSQSTVPEWSPVPGSGVGEEAFLEMAERWFDFGAGAAVIGGCCGVTPPLIRRLKQRILNIL